MATLKPGAAILAFPAGWLWYSLRGGERRPLRVAARAVLAQAGLVGTLVVADRAAAVVRAGRAGLGSLRHPDVQVRTHRRAVVDAVAAAADAGWHRYTEHGQEPPVPLAAARPAPVPGPLP
jgi:hypothetical protein